MKIPALRAQMGDWTYYVTTLTFEQVNTFVSRVDKELHKSEGLKDLIQRSITDNYISIKDYILKQPELFFNSLVLAVYDDYPSWREIEFTYEGEETYQMGLLEFPGTHKIFPVDGQHRVEGIKAALVENPDLKNQRIGAIFIGHKNDDTGKRRTRRLFTTLNRYAKAVSLDDIIALDEDDTVAIITRFLLEEYDLFTSKRVISDEQKTAAANNKDATSSIKRVAYTKQKAMPANNKDAITSIITLYQSNLELFKFFFEKKFNKKPTTKVLTEYLKFRPSQSEIDTFQDFCVNYWDAFKTKLTFISSYLEKKVSPVGELRNNETGGNIIFRPIGFLPFVKVSLVICSRRENTLKENSFEKIFEHFNSINFYLDSKPWHSVAWNPIEKKMIMGSDSIIQLLLLYLYDENILTEKELKTLKEGYASKLAYEGDNIENILEGIK